MVVRSASSSAPTWARDKTTYVERCRLLDLLWGQSLVADVDTGFTEELEDTGLAEVVLTSELVTGHAGLVGRHQLGGGLRIEAMVEAEPGTRSLHVRFDLVRGCRVSGR